MALYICCWHHEFTMLWTKVFEFEKCHWTKDEESISGSETLLNTFQKQTSIGVLVGVLKISSKFGEHPYRNVISIKLQSKCIKITYCHGCSPVNLLHIFRTPFSKNSSGGLRLTFLHDMLNSLKYQHWTTTTKKFRHKT